MQSFLVSMKREILNCTIREEWQQQGRWRCDLQILEDEACDSRVGISRVGERLVMQVVV